MMSSQTDKMLQAKGNSTDYVTSVMIPKCTSFRTDLIDWLADIKIRIIVYLLLLGKFNMSQKGNDYDN